MNISRTTTICLAVYAIGVLVTASYSGWSAIEGGGLQREHDLRDWVQIACFYGLVSLLWPVIFIAIVFSALGWVKVPFIIRRSVALKTNVASRSSPHLYRGAGVDPAFLPNSLLDLRYRPRSKSLGERK
jgi:hypothetical protein